MNSPLTTAVPSKCGAGFETAIKINRLCKLYQYSLMWKCMFDGKSACVCNYLVNSIEIFFYFLCCLLNFNQFRLKLTDCFSVLQLMSIGFWSNWINMASSSRSIWNAWFFFAWDLVTRQQTNCYQNHKS